MIIIQSFNDSGEGHTLVKLSQEDIDKLNKGAQIIDYEFSFDQYIAISFLKILIKDIEALKNKAFVDDLNTIMKELEIDGLVGYVDKPRGDKQTIEETIDSEVKTISYIWVNQTTNGGFTGDDFAGEIYIEIEENKYLEMYYQM